MSKHVRYFTLILTVFISGFLFVSMPVSAAEAKNSNDTFAPDAITLSDSWREGTVMNNGVRLRAEPNLDCTIYGLMNKDETVLVNLEMSTMTFYYVQRVKTGEYGYVSRNYVLVWTDDPVTVSED